MRSQSGIETNGRGLLSRMLRGLPLAVALIVFIGPWWPVASATPANDDFASATAIALDFTESVSTLTATTESSEPTPCLIGNTLWYRLTPASDLSIQADTFGSGFNTVLAAYAGTSLGDLVMIACNDDAGGTEQSQLGFVATAGITYFFQVGGFFGSAGDLTFHASGTALAPPPANDDFGSAMAIQRLPFANDLSTQAASSEPGEPAPFCASIANTVWYVFAPSSEVRVQADTFGSDYDTVLAVYVGTSFSDMVNVACGDDDSGTRQSFAEFTSTAGLRYFFQVGGFGGAKGTLAFHVTGPDGDLTPPTIACPGGRIQYSAAGPLTFVDIGAATASDDSGSVAVTNDAPTSHLFHNGATTITWTATDPTGNGASCVQSVIVTDLPRSAVTDSRLCDFDRDPSLAGQQFGLNFRRERHQDRDDDRDDDRAGRSEGRDRDDDDRERGRRNTREFRLRSSGPRSFAYNVFYLGTPGSPVTLDVNIPYPFVTRGSDSVQVHGGARSESGCFVPSNPLSGFAITGTRSVTESGAVRIRLRDFGCHTPPTPVPSCPSLTVTVSGTVPSSGLVYVTFRLGYGLLGEDGFGTNAANDATDRRSGAVLIPNLGTYTFGVSGGIEDVQWIQNENVFESRARRDD